SVLIFCCGANKRSDPSGGGTSGGAPSTGAVGNVGGTGGSLGTGGGLGGAGAASSDESLSSLYPGDVGIDADPAVIFADDFEGGWGKWNAPVSDTEHLFIENGAESHSGSGYLRSTVTFAQLEEDEYISSSTRIDFSRRTEAIYIRFYAQFKGISVTPHHWVRVAAGNEDFQSSGLANTVPAGDAGFWFDFDVSTEDVFNFYVYWYKMRSGRCNDGTAVPGCEGDQGS